MPIVWCRIPVFKLEYRVYSCHNFEKHHGVSLIRESSALSMRSGVTTSWLTARPASLERGPTRKKHSSLGALIEMDNKIRESLSCQFLISINSISHLFIHIYCCSSQTLSHFLGFAWDYFYAHSWHCYFLIISFLFISWIWFAPC